MEFNCWDFEVKRVVDFSLEKVLMEEDLWEVVIDDDVIVIEIGVIMVEVIVEVIVKIFLYLNCKGNVVNSLGIGDIE